MLCKLGKKSTEEENLWLGLDKIGKLIYVLKENADLFGRLFAWFTIMIWIFHCNLRNKMEKLNFYDGLTSLLILSILMNPVILLWIMNYFREKYQNKLRKKNGAIFKNINNLSDVSYILFAAKNLYEEKLIVSWVSDSSQIFEGTKFMGNLNSLNFFQKNFANAISIIIEKDSNLMTLTERSLQKFLKPLISEKLIENSDVKNLGFEKNYKFVEDYDGCITKMGEFENIIADCDFQIDGNCISAIDKSKQENIFKEMESKDIDKILAISRTIDGKNTFLGLIGFEVGYEYNEKISDCLNMFKNLNIKIICFSERKEVECKKIFQDSELSIQEFKNFEDIANANFSSVTFLTESNQNSISGLLKLLKEEEQYVIFCSNEEMESIFFDEQRTVLVSYDHDQYNNFNNSNFEINLKNEPINTLAKAIILNKSLSIHLRNCLFSKIIISMTLGLIIFVRFCVFLESSVDMNMYSFVSISLFGDIYLMTLVFTCNEFNEDFILKSKRKKESVYLVNPADIFKMISIVVVSLIFLILITMSLKENDVYVIFVLIIGGIFNSQYNKKQVLLIGLYIGIIAFLQKF